MKYIMLSIMILASASAAAETEVPDTLKTQDLQEVVVEASPTNTSAKKTTYIPTSRQKHASQTGSELLNRMAIPQLKISDGDNIETASGQAVAVYINFLPASQNDLTTMRTADVKRVDYLDYPSDPRFQGNAHVINFIMQQYEYGGYVKAYANENFNYNSGQLNLYSKLQYKRMTYDIGVAGFYASPNHGGSDKIETFRLPQIDGSIKEFERFSDLSDVKIRRQDYWTTFKALYNTDKITINNIIATDFDHTPTNDSHGSVSYTPDVFSENPYSNYSSSRVNSVTYSGNWNFILSKGNSISFNPYYSYSHTNQFSDYSESESLSYINGARDNSHQAKAVLTYGHDFGKGGQLNVQMQGIFTSNRTYYSGTSTVNDRAKTYRIGPGVSYSITVGNFYGSAGVGLMYDKSSYGDIKEKSTTPWVDFSLQYSFAKKHRFGIEFHHMRSVPSSAYRSASVVQVNPLFSYTGNPALVPYKSYDPSISYSFFPNNKYSITAFAYGWIVQDRYVYDYEANANGILRTIKQPLGSYAQVGYGVNLSTRQFNNKLQIGVNLRGYTAHNGAPYDWTKSKFTYSIQGYYYAGAFDFGAAYISRNGYADGCMVGTWMTTKDTYRISVGWSNASWNIRAYFYDFGRWNWKGNVATTKSKYYDVTEHFYGVSDHACFRLSATYTFGFGKKIKQGNEASQVSGVSSGILK